MSATLSLTATTSIKDLLEFIKNYQYLEKLPLKEGQKMLQGALSSKVHPSTIAHVCDQWRWKDREFGAFWLNLDPRIKLAILKAWCFQVEGSEAYVKKVEEDPMSAMYLLVPAFLRNIDNMVMFFCNHSIADDTAEEINLPAVPVDLEKQYGNAQNWAQYILSFGPVMESERNYVLTMILEYYPKRRLTNQ